MYTFKNHRENDLELIGLLATNEDMNPDGYGIKEPIFINSNGDIQYYVKAISENSPKRLFTGYINSIINNENLDVPGINYNSHEARIEDFVAAVKDNLFLFTYYTSGEYTKISQAILLPIQSEAIKGDEVFVSVPMYSPRNNTQDYENLIKVFLNRKYNSFEEFLDLIKNKQNIGKVSHYEGRDDFPSFIIWKDTQSFYAIGPFNSGSLNYNGITLSGKEIYKLDIQKYLKFCIDSEYNPTVLQMQQKAYENVLAALLKKEGELIYIQSNENVNATSDIDTSINSIETNVASKETATVDYSFVNDPVILNTEVKDEKLFLQLFRYQCENKNLFYDLKDLSNFHTSAKTGSMVILSGMSGTGKSALVDAYARALGINTGVRNQLLTIPVRPSWTDDSDLLGYVDLVHRVYRPSDTGLIKHLIDASENENELYVICLDEMNLARVEHYFSQFLSILEKPEGQRHLRLYDEEYTGNLYNAKDYPPSIAIGNNIKFIGTVNIDESTYHFADKVLDRANVINLKVCDYRMWETTKYSMANRVEWSYKDYKEFINKDNPRLPEIRSFLWDIHTTLSSTNSNFGVGPRIVISIEKYINNKPICDDEFDISHSEALDFQLKQRILTKLRGPQEQFGELLSDDKNENSILHIISKYSTLSNFVMSKKVIDQKKKELKIYGYCL